MKQRVTLFLDPKLVKLAKAHALDVRKSLSTIVEETLNQALPRHVTVTVIKEKQKPVIVHARVKYVCNKCGGDIVKTGPNIEDWKCKKCGFQSPKRFLAE